MPGGYTETLVLQGGCLARAGRIRAGGLEGTLLCKQSKQMLAGVLQVVVPVADGEC